MHEKKLKFWKIEIYFYRKWRKLNQQNEDCEKYSAARIIMPTGKNILKFKLPNYYIDFIEAYAGFECILYPVHTCLSNPEISFTVIKNFHITKS